MPSYTVSGNTLFWCADVSVLFFRKTKLLQVCILVLLKAKTVLQNVAQKQFQCKPAIKGPLTCKTFIAEKGSALLVEKLRGTLSCKQLLHEGESQGLSYPYLSFVISDVIKTGLLAVCRDVTRGMEVDG